MKQGSGIVSQVIRSIWFHSLILVSLAIGLAARPAPAGAQDGTVTLSAAVLLDGYCKPQRWLPIRVTLENTGTDLEARIVASSSASLTSRWEFSQNIDLPGVSRKETTLYVYPPRTINEITISLLVGGKVTQEKQLPLTCVKRDDTLFGVIADSPSAFNVLNTLDPPSGRAWVAEIRLSELPDKSQGLGALDFLVISNVDTGKLTSKQVQALENWVANGGRLLVTGGTAWQKTSAGLQPLLAFIPTGSKTVPDLAAISSLGQDADPLEGRAIIATGTVASGAEVLVNQEGTPLIIRKGLGFGESLYLTPDPAQAPFREWAGTEGFYQSLFAGTLDTPSWVRGFIDWNSAADAISSFPGLRLPSFLLICGFLSLYVLALGPLNYWILHRIKRRELAWASIPALVLVFSGIAFIFGTFVRGNKPILHQMAVVQVWPDAGQARVDGLVGIFSPQRETYRVKLGGDLLAYPFPEGRMVRSGPLNFLQNSSGVEVQDLKVEVGGMTTLAVQGALEAVDFANDLTFIFSGTDVFLDGTITNQSDLTLENAVLIGPGISEKIGRFSPGMTHPIRFSLLPSQANTSGKLSTSPPYYGSNQTVQEILGADYYSFPDDPDVRGKYDLLTAAISNAGSPGGGIFLTGWSDSSPLEVDLPGYRFKRETATFYVIAFSPSLSQEPTLTTLPPAMFTWDVLEQASSGPSPSPYNMFLSQGSYALRFYLARPIPYRSVKALILHLKSSNQKGPTDLNLSLWNFTTNTWQQVPIQAWGDHSLPQPERWVGSGGEIRLRVEVSNQSYGAEIDTSDFTLVVER